MLDVAPAWRRKGVATLLFRQMLKDNPGLRFDPGMMTGPGLEFVRAMRPYLKRYRRQRESLREYNQCHDPETGQFCSGWHLTAKANFKVDPTFKPEWNSIAGDLAGDNRPAGIFVTDQPEYWMQAHGYERPYVAQIEGRATNPPGTVMHKGREQFIQGETKVLRVLTIDEYAREVFGEPGWVETHFGDPVPAGWSNKFGRSRAPKGYKARSVAEMSPAEVRAWERKFKKWANRADGPRRRAEAQGY